MDDCLIDSFLLTAAASSYWLDPANYFAILKVLIGLGAVIFVHELGHFLVAKACGVKCEKFYVGFDVPIGLFGQTLIPGKLFHFQWGETEYGLGSIPLGGYVKMLGQDDNPGNVEEQLQGSLAEGESADSAILPSGMIDRSKLDPRSYMAKSVPQRMAIISAGVIFNLIFAILFAAIAFRSGVTYEPAVLGNVVGGGPAWKHNLVGGRILAVGDRKIEADDYFPYRNFAESVVFNGDASPIAITFLPPGETEPVTAQLTPEKGFMRSAPDLAMIGAEHRLTPTIGEAGTLEGTPAANADPPMKAGDRIVEVNGVPIETEIDLRQAMARFSDQTTTFVLQRPTDQPGETERITTKIAPNPFRELGFSTEWGPVSAIKIGSPAEQAGIQVGDEIVSINGESRGNLMTVDQRLIKMIENNQPVTLQIRRNGEVSDVSIEPIVPPLFSPPGPNKPIAIDAIGVAIPVGLTVDEVQAGSPAEQAYLNPGDKLLSVEYLLSEDQQKMDRYADLIERSPIEFAKSGEETSWGEVFMVLQQMEPGTGIRFQVKRKRTEQPISITMETVASDEYFQPRRGFFLAPMQADYLATSWSDAFKYGAYQVGYDLKRVFTTLTELIRGKISPKNLGGPGTIAVVATSEATRGTSRLLLFLTFLSANLAIINFLPIPVLDGGHMVFLAYEGIFRRPVNERVQLILTYGGLIFILGLMAFVLFLDAGRIIV